MRTTAEQNKRFVLEAFDTFFNRDYKGAKRYWSPNHIQHSAHIEPGRDGLFNLIWSAPPTLKYEPGLIVAEGDYVIVHGGLSGRGSSVNWIAADILRMENGVLQEHWDVLHADTPPIGVHFLDYSDKEINELGARGIGEIGLAGIATAI